MATQDPWAEFRTGPARQAPSQPSPMQQAPAVRPPGVIQGAPRQAPPVTPVQQQSMANDTERLRIAQAEEARRAALFEQEQSEVAPPEGAGRVAKLQSMLEQLERAEALFGENIEGGLPNPIWGRINPWSEGNSQFGAAASAMAQQAFSAFREPGSGPQSDADLRLFTEANRPLPTDTDAAIREKLMAVRQRAEAELEALGGSVAEQPREPSALSAGLATGGTPPDDDPRERDEFGNPIGALVTVTAGPEGDGGSEIDPAIAQEADQIEAVMGEAGLQKLFNNVGGFSDEAGGVARVITEALRGDFNISDNYVMGRDVERELIRRARERTGGLGTAAEAVGNTAMVMGKAGSVMRAGRAAAARTGAVTRPAVQGEMVRQATHAGAGVGAVGGFGYGEGVEGSVTGAVTGAAVGGALGNAGQRVGNRVANRIPPQTAARDTMDAATQLGIDVTPAVVGGPTTQRLTAGARQGFISDRPISQAVDNMQAQGGVARARIAGEAGQPANAEDAGEIVRQAANVYSRRTSEIGSRLYERAARQAGDTQVPLPGAVQRIDEALAELKQAPGGENEALFRDLTRLREQMDGGSFRPSGVRQMRTRLREQMQERGLRGSNTDRVYGQIADAAEADMIAGLQQAGKGNAANAYQTASQFWRRRIETIDSVLEPVLGKNSPRSGEQVLAALERMARPDSGNTARLRQVFAAMPKEEAASVRATIINRLGRPTKGSSEMLDEDSFSFERFMTSWNDMTPRARRVVFGDQTDALNQLATVASAVKQAGSAANTSNTAGSIAVQAAISTPQMWLLEPFTVFGLTAGQYSAGRLLASTRFARWLAGAPRTTASKARNAYISRLNEVARAEPALARDIEAFRRQLTSAGNDNSPILGNVAASDDEQQQP